jgi:hypothetical protein
LRVRVCAHALQKSCGCTSTSNMDSDALFIERNECPLCKNGPRKGKINPRRALQEHLRSSTDPAHLMWKHQHYAHHFKHGGARTTAAEVTAESVIEAVKFAFGAKWSSRVSLV